MKMCLSLVLAFLSFQLAAQDTLVFKNNDMLLGEVKDLTNGVLQVETTYSESDFTVDWLKVKRISTSTNFMISTSDRQRLNGRLRTDPSNPGHVTVVPAEGPPQTIPHSNIVGLLKVSEGFWDRLNLFVSGGYSITKASNVRQLTFSSIADYDADHYSIDANYNTLVSSTQDTIKAYRSNYGFQFKYYVHKSIFLFAATDWLESNEQDLNRRTNVTLGAGSSFIRSNRMRLSFALGASRNTEDFLTEGVTTRISNEGYARLEANLFGFDDLSLYSKLETYPSLTEKGRVRVNFSFNTKYDLPLDLFISINYTLNYDNQPQPGFSSHDYVFTTTLGWEF